MPETALLLTDENSDGHLEKILNFFGVNFEKSSAQKFLEKFRAKEFAENFSGEKFKILLSAKNFAELLNQNFDAEFWQKNVHSVFIHAANDFNSLENVIQKIVARTSCPLIENKNRNWSVAENFKEFCGALSGIKIAANESVKTFDFAEAKTDAEKIIFNETGTAFARFNFQSIPIFISTSANIIDLDATLTRNFDIREHFFSAVPIVLFIKWAFAKTIWQSPETGACLIIDDPLLKPRYGFLSFARLHDLIRRHNFSTSIAFIPWNWRRSAKKIVELFRQNPEKFSLSIHGCDHSGGEFGIQNSERLAWKTKSATLRMRAHENKTKIVHDRVMIFPQGVFSANAMRALKRDDFIGVVNTEIASSDSPPRALKISELWNVALTSYDFPIFTRRYPKQGLENFAFDILLGKPCLVVIHHNDCRDRCEPLVKFIDQLNALNAKLCWRNLSEVIRRSFRQKEISADEIEIEMFGGELRLENFSTRKKLFCVFKSESEISAVKEIRVENETVVWKNFDDKIVFQIELNPDESKLIKIIFHASAENKFKGENLSYRFKVALRRYLSEARDNYITSKPFSA